MDLVGGGIVRYGVHAVREEHGDDATFRVCGGWVGGWVSGCCVWSVGCSLPLVRDEVVAWLWSQASCGTVAVAAGVA